MTFNWAGMWTFGAVMIAIIAVLFMIFRESDNEITAIKVDDRDIALTQGKLNENRTYSRCSLWAGVRGCDGDALRALAAVRVKALLAGLTVFCRPKENNAACYFNRAEFTDDTSMALCLADALLEREGKIDPDLIGRISRLGAAFRRL